MKMIKVKSSNIESIGYYSRTFQLFVEFKATDRSPSNTFIYEDVSPAEHEALMNADSVGKHFSSYIKAVKECWAHERDAIHVNEREASVRLADDGLSKKRALEYAGKDEATEQEKENNDWISVNDRLPDDYTFTLCWFNGRAEVMQVMWESPSFEESFYPFPYWADEQERFTPDLREVTHWMTLPNPPTT